MYDVSRTNGLKSSSVSGALGTKPMGNAGVACCWWCSSPNTAKHIDVLNLKSKGVPKMVSGRQTSPHYKRLKTRLVYLMHSTRKTTT